MKFFRNSRKVETNIYIALTYRILLLYVLYTFCRLAFFIYNSGHYPGIPLSRLTTIFIGGFKFDTSAILYTNLLFIIASIIPFKIRHHNTYQKVIKYWFFIINSIALFANCADIPYFNFVLERTTFNVFSQFKNETNMGALFGKFIIDYWSIALFYIFLLLLMIFLYNRVMVKAAPARKYLAYYSTALAVAILVVILTIGGLRGGFRHSTRPITLSNAGEYVENPSEMAIVLNTPFCIIRTITAKTFKRVEYFKSTKELNSIYNPIHTPDSTNKMKNLNVVIIIVESLNKEFIGSLNTNLDNGTFKGYTPFVDSLLKSSLTFKYSFANGHKSIEAMPSVLASIPSIEKPFVLGPYYKNNLTSIARLLKEKGYRSAFFHGAPNGSMGFQAFAKLAGFDAYYGKDEYNNDKDFDGIWGIWDEEFLQFYAKTLDTIRQPFLGCVFTLSSHHPFKVPERYEKTFGEGYFPLMKCIKYTDYSLQKFFETASKMSWYKNTLFVITADHANAIQRQEYQNEAGYFSIPIIFYQPGSNLKGYDTTTVAQQSDIMPTILNYLGYDKPYFAYGQDLLNADSSKFAINYLNGTYNLFQGNYLLQRDDKKVLHLFNFKTDQSLHNDLAEKDTTTQKRLEHTLKAFIQHYKNKMIDNDMVVK